MVPGARRGRQVYNTARGRPRDGSALWLRDYRAGLALTASLAFPLLPYSMPPWAAIIFSRLISCDWRVICLRA